MIAKAEIPQRIEIICTKLKQIKLKFLSAKQLKSVLHLGVGITSTPETVLHHSFGGLLYGWHRSGITFPPPPLQNRRLLTLHFAVPKNITVMQFIN